jgi:predicted MFS family arabinose efflux permease
MRITLMNMGEPVRSAFGMEILAPSERGTQVGLQHAFSGLLTGGAAFLGARLMDAGDFQSPFFFMAGAYLIGTVLFWRFFRGKERQMALVPNPVAGGQAAE